MCWCRVCFHHGDTEGAQRITEGLDGLLVLRPSIFSVSLCLCGEERAGAGSSRRSGCAGRTGGMRRLSWSRSQGGIALCMTGSCHLSISRNATDPGHAGSRQLPWWKLYEWQRQWSRLTQPSISSVPLCRSLCASVLSKRPAPARPAEFILISNAVDVDAGPGTVAAQGVAVGHAADVIGDRQGLLVGVALWFAVGQGADQAAVAAVEEAFTEVGQ